MNDEFEQIIRGLGESQTDVWAEAIKESIFKTAEFLNEIFRHLIEMGLPREIAIYIITDLWDILSARES